MSKLLNRTILYWISSLIFVTLITWGASSYTHLDVSLIFTSSKLRMWTAVYVAMITIVWLVYFITEYTEYNKFEFKKGQILKHKTRGSKLVILEAQLKWSEPSYRVVYIDRGSSYFVDIGEISIHYETTLKDEFITTQFKEG